jgi:hypothetical protein
MALIGRIALFFVSLLITIFNPPFFHGKVAA